MVRIPAETAKRIKGHVAKYMGILEIPGEPPGIKVHNDPDSFWYGRTSSHAEIDGETGSLVGIGTTLELQKRILKNDRYLERVIAHEMIHHRDFVTMPAEERAKLESAIAAGEFTEVADDKEEPSDKEPTEIDDEADKKAHGPSFREGVARINAIMGPDFVVEAIEELPEERKASTTITLALGFGGLAVLTGVLLARKLRSTAAQREPVPRGPFPAFGLQSGMPRGVMRTTSMPVPPARRRQPARDNERGHYRRR